MLRKELLEVLDLVKPALSSDGLVSSVFSNFCFTNGQVYAYQDKLGIVGPCAVEDTFGVNGKVFMELLRASSAAEVEITLDKENVLVKNGRSKMKLPFVKKDEFLFEEPEQETWQIILDINDELLQAFELCLHTAADDSTMPGFMGLTIKGGADCRIYSCDGDSLSQFDLSVKGAPQVLYTMPSEFAEAVLKIAEATACNVGQLYVNNEWALVEFGNDYKVYGRIIQIADPYDHESQMQRIMSRKPKFIEIPEGMGDALSRARVVADIESKPTVIKVSGGKAEMVTDTHMGVVRDSFRIDKGQKDVEASVFAKLIQRGVTACDRFALFDDCTVYKREDGYTLLIANYEG